MSFKALSNVNQAYNNLELSDINNLWIVLDTKVNYVTMYVGNIIALNIWIASVHNVISKNV